MAEGAVISPFWFCFSGLQRDLASFRGIGTRPFTQGNRYSGIGTQGQAMRSKTRGKDTKIGKHRRQIEQLKE